MCASLFDPACAYVGSRISLSRSWLVVAHSIIWKIRVSRQCPLLAECKPERKTRSSGSVTGTIRGRFARPILETPCCDPRGNYGNEDWIAILDHFMCQCVEPRCIFPGDQTNINSINDAPPLGPHSDGLHWRNYEKTYQKQILYAFNTYDRTDCWVLWFQPFLYFSATRLKELA